MIRRAAGFTWIEALTVLVVLVVLAAIAIPLWHVRELRSHRSAATQVLLALQSAQDDYFGKHARYAEADQLDWKPPPQYRVTVRRTADELGYLATARAAFTDGLEDPRCVEFSIDQHGRRSAVDEAGADRSADCWNVD